MNKAMDSNKHKMKIEDIRKDNPFKVPEFYFDGLQNEISDRIIAQKNVASAGWLWSLTRPKMVATLAFASAALIIVSIFVFQPTGSQTKITDTELADLYQVEVLNQKSENELIKELENLTITETVTDSAHITLNDEIATYLKDDVDIATLVDAL